MVVLFDRNAEEQFTNLENFITSKLEKTVLNFSGV